MKLKRHFVFVVHRAMILNRGAQNPALFHMIVIMINQGIGKDILFLKARRKMISDFVDGDSIRVIAHCPKCNSQHVNRVTCSTDRGLQELGIECADCGAELSENELRWKNNE